MEFEELLEIVGDAPIFETGLLLAGEVDQANVQRQLSRWTAAGRIYQLRRGVYALAPPYRKAIPHPFVTANMLVDGSYVSLQAALAYYGMIPDVTPVVTSVTTGRPGRWETPLGSYAFRHVKMDWFHGYRRREVGGEQRAFVATPEKALLDLVYLEPRADQPAYLNALRLQALDRLDAERLDRLARKSGSHKLQRAVQAIGTLAQDEAAAYETL